MTEQLLTFRAPVLEANAARRTITGRIVPFGEVGQTSAGPTRIVAGAFGSSFDAGAIRLHLEHDRQRPIGRATSIVASDAELVGTFRVAGTTAGSDALIEAAEQLRDGLSVEARVLEAEPDADGVLVVTAAELVGVGLVATPAFDPSRVQHVAASQPPQEEPPVSTPAAPPATPPADDPSTPAPLTAADVSAIVADQLAAANPPEPPAPRVESVRDRRRLTAGSVARAIVLAANGDEQAAEVVTAAREAERELVLEGALAVSTTSGNAGVVPTPQLADWIDAVRVGRPTVEALSHRELPQDGMQFELPRWVVKPITAETAEGVQIATQATQIDNLSVDVAKIAGGNRVSVELVERSSPAYLEELIDALVSDFQQKSNAYAFGKINPARTLAADQHSVGASTVEQYAQGIADAYANSKKLPDRSLGGLNKWVALQSERDTTGRPLFSAYNPQNAAGSIRNSLTGEVMGTRFALETDAAADDLLVFPSEAARYYEQPGAPFTVRLMQVSTLEWEVAVYGFCAVAVKHPKAVRWLTDTAPV